MLTAFTNIDVAWRETGKLTNCTNSLLPVCLRGSLGLNPRWVVLGKWHSRYLRSTLIFSC